MAQLCQAESGGWFGGERVNILGVTVFVLSCFRKLSDKNKHRGVIELTGFSAQVGSVADISVMKSGRTL